MDNRTLEKLRDELCKYNHPKGSAYCINILLFGTEGVGKTPVINTFLCALSADSRTVTHVPMRDNSGSLSQQLHHLEHDCNVADYPENLENVIHGIALIFDVSAEDISDDTVNQFQELQRLAAQKFIYNIVTGTKFDLLDIEENDHEWIYECKPLQEKFQKLLESTKIEKRFMFVVSNQCRSNNITRTKCILALYALENMVRNIDKHLMVTSEMD